MSSPLTGLRLTSSARLNSGPFLRRAAVLSPDLSLALMAILYALHALWEGAHVGVDQH